MPKIDLNRYGPMEGQPGHSWIVGQPTAQEVFAQLEQHLESVGYLPDDYFSLDRDWQNGVKIPANADIVCTADYGGSEGVYLNIALRWHDDAGNPHTKHFITGKTLDDTPSALDRMHLAASAIMDAVHGSGHARYIKLNERAEPTGVVLHLSPAEQQLMVESLVAQRSRMKGDFIETERLLRRAVGSITEFVNALGERPLKLDAYETAMLAIDDGNFAVFQEHYKNAGDRIGDLLIRAAGRPGTVGHQMLTEMLEFATGVSHEHYLEASKRAVDTGHVERVLELCRKAEACTTGLKPYFYGEIINHASSTNQSHMARALADQCSPAQITAAHGYVLYAVALRKDYTVMGTLVSKGIDADHYAGDIFRAMAVDGGRYAIEDLLSKGMKISPTNYAALHEAIDLGLVSVAERLLDSGMSFSGYSQWAEQNKKPLAPEKLEPFRAYGEAAQAQDVGQSLGG